MVGNLRPGFLLCEIGMRTRLSICRKKASYGTDEEARDAAAHSGLELRTYRCDRCGQFHLTSRTKGKRIPRPQA